MALATVNQMISHLSDEEMQRYSQKIDILGFDPYLLPNQLLTPLKSVVILPNISFGDIYTYLVHNPSPYTGESLKAYKSMEAYMYFKSGWVNDPRVYHLEMKKLFLFTGKVTYVTDVILRCVFYLWVYHCPDKNIKNYFCMMFIRPM